jgi:hypothetical protein
LPLPTEAKGWQKELAAVPEEVLSLPPLLPVCRDE